MGLFDNAIASATSAIKKSGSNSSQDRAKRSGGAATQRLSSGFNPITGSQFSDSLSLSGQNGGRTKMGPDRNKQIQNYQDDLAKAQSSPTGRSILSGIGGGEFYDDSLYGSGYDFYSDNKKSGDGANEDPILFVSQGDVDTSYKYDPTMTYQDMYDIWAADYYGGDTPYDDFTSFQAYGNGDDWYDWAKFTNKNYGMYNDIGVDWSADDDAAKEAFINGFYNPNEQVDFNQMLVDPRYSMSRGQADLDNLYEFIRENPQYTMGSADGSLIIDTDHGFTEDQVEGILKDAIATSQMQSRYNGTGLDDVYLNELEEWRMGGNAAGYGSDGLGRVAYGPVGATAEGAPYMVVSLDDTQKDNVVSQLASMDAFDPTLYLDESGKYDPSALNKYLGLGAAGSNVGVMMPTSDYNNMYVPAVYSAIQGNDSDKSQNESSEKEK